MADLQGVLLKIEERAARFGADPAQEEPQKTSASVNLCQSPGSLQKEKSQHPTPPISTAPHATAAKIENQPEGKAVRQILRRLAERKQSILLLLSEAPLSGDTSKELSATPCGIWGTTFADLIDAPVLSVGITSATDERQPRVIQSQHPGLCTLHAPSDALWKKGPATWWPSMRSRFGVILIDGSGQDRSTLQRLVSLCGNVLFLVEYRRTTRIWAHQVRKLVAAYGGLPLGCITEA